MMIWVLVKLSRYILIVLITVGRVYFLLIDEMRVYIELITNFFILAVVSPSAFISMDFVLSEITIRWLWFFVINEIRYVDLYLCVSSSELTDVYRIGA